MFLIIVYIRWRKSSQTQQCTLLCLTTLPSSYILHTQRGCFNSEEVLLLLFCVRQTSVVFFISETSRYSDFYKRHNACHSKSVFNNYISEVPNGGRTAWKPTVKFVNSRMDMKLSCKPCST
jgi:hypothetical protein